MTGRTAACKRLPPSERREMSPSESARVGTDVLHLQTRGSRPSRVGEEGAAAGGVRLAVPRSQGRSGRSGGLPRDLTEAPARPR